MPFPDGCLKLFEEFQNRRIRYLVVGLAAVALQGGVIATDDLDLWVEDLSKPDFQACVTAAGGVYIPPLDLRPPTISGHGLDGIDLVMHMSGLGSFPDEYRHVCWIPLGSIQVPVLSLERIIFSKRAANRPKDRAVLPIIEELARTQETMKQEQKRNAPAKDSVSDEG